MVGTVAGVGRVLLRVALFAVDVVRAVGGEHRWQTERLGLLHRLLGRIPAEHFGTGGLDDVEVGTAGGDGLVPNGELTATLFHKFAELLNEIALELTIVGEAFGFVESLAFGIVFPGVDRTFVTADVDALTREEVHDFGEDVFGKLHGGGVGDVDDIVRNASLAPHLVAARGIAAIFGIGSHCGRAVARHVDFWHDGDVALLGIGHHVANFVLRVEVRAVGLVNPILLGLIEIGEEAIGGDAAHGGELRIFLDFHTPALVVGEVPVEGVHLIVRHDVEHAFHLVDREEVARDVEHEAAIVKARFVGNGHQWNGVRRNGVLHCERVFFTGHHVGGKQFLHALEGIEEARGGLGLDVDFVEGHGEGVAAVFEFRGGIEFRHLEEGVGIIGHDADLCACHRRIEIGEALHFVDFLFGQSRMADTEL